MLRLRQVALAVRDLESAAQSVVSELSVRECFRDPVVAQFGLENVLFPVGDDFLELVAPVDANASAGRFIERRGGDTGYMVILQTEDPLGWRKRLAAKGVRSVFDIDHPPGTGTHFHPADTGGVLLSIDGDSRATSVTDRMAPWPYAGTEWEQAAGAGDWTGILRVDLESPDPEAQAALWSTLLETPVSRGGEAPELVLSRGSIRFVPDGGRGQGVAGITLAGGTSRKPFDLLGCRIETL